MDASLKTAGILQASNVPSVIYFIIMATVTSSVEKNKAISFIETQGRCLYLEAVEDMH